MSTVGKAVSLLELFTLHEPEIGLSDLARRAGLDKATARRLLMALLQPARTPGECPPQRFFADRSRVE